MSVWPVRRQRYYTTHHLIYLICLYTSKQETSLNRNNPPFSPLLYTVTRPRSAPIYCLNGGRNQDIRFLKSPTVKYNITIHYFKQKTKKLFIMKLQEM